MELKRMWHGLSIVRHRAARAMVVGAVITIFSGGAWGQCELQKMLASDGGNSEFYGFVSLCADVAVVGAPDLGDNQARPGSAFVYRHDGTDWVEEVKLVASDAEVDDHFGWSVDVQGDVLIVGAWADDDLGDKSGSAYVFRYDGSTWVEEAKLLPSDGAAGDWFGFPVAIDDGVAVVGTVGQSDNGSFSGCAYIFRYDGAEWIEEAKLSASDAAENDWFGYAVAISGDAVVVGAYGNDDNGDGSGSAYVFRNGRGGWTEEMKLVASDASQYDGFGNSVAIEEDLAAVGAIGDDDLAVRAGSAYMFRFDGSTWQEETKLTAIDADYEDAFGSAVDICGDAILIGAYRNTCFEDQTGSAYIFRYDGSTWSEEVWLLASDGEDGDWFGFSVALSEDYALIGSPFDDGETGSAYFFPTVVVDDCNENLISDGCDIVKGVSEDINGNGIPDECECLADANSDGVVDLDDILTVLGAWGPCNACPEDVNCDGMVDIDDVFAVLSAWGPC